MQCQLHIYLNFNSICLKYSLIVRDDRMTSKMSKPRRKITKRACDGCKIRKIIKCSGLSRCDGCVAVRISCTYLRHPSTRGPRKLRQSTLQEIAHTQRQRRGPATPPLCRGSNCSTRECTGSNGSGSCKVRHESTTIGLYTDSHEIDPIRGYQWPLWSSTFVYTDYECFLYGQSLKWKK